MTPTRTLAVALLLAATSSGCGGSADPPFTLRVQADDVVISAVTRLEIEVDPTPRRFAPMEPEVIEDHDGVAELSVSAAGEFLMRFDSAWVQAHQVDTPVGAFAVDVPIWSDQEIELMSDPTLIGRIFRQGEQITDDMRSTRFLQFPPPPGGMAILMIRCDAATPRQCTNNDP